LEHQASHDKESRADDYAMNEEQLAKRFWWWRDKSILAAMRPNLQRIAFYYELASRSEKGRPRYLLGKRFDKLTRAQMWENARYWPRRPLKIETLYTMPSFNEPFQLEKLHRELRKIRSGWSDSRREFAKMSPPTRKEKETVETHEHACAAETGWTLPQYFSFNLRQCGNTTILKELKAWLERERKRLNIDPPKRNKGRQNRSGTEKKDIKFRAIEALDTWRNFPHKDDAQNAYDPTGGQARKAAREAQRLRREWEANVRSWRKWAEEEEAWEMRRSGPTAREEAFNRLFFSG
jgi:hypothetical protein